jgi:kynureninase
MGPDCGTYGAAVTSRSDAATLDAADPLRRFRDEFLTPDPDVVYLDGNSLGMPPRRTAERLASLVTGEWGTGLIGSWATWLDMPQRVGDRLAPLIGARPGEVVVHDSTTVNLYQLVHAGLALRPDRSVIAVGEGEFPTDRYVVDGIAASARSAAGRSLTVRDGFDRLDDVAVAVRSVVDYRSAEVVDIVAETARARDAGALMLWDLSHAAGVLVVDLHAAGAELAVGCTYKFLNGGPGAPAWSYVAQPLQASLEQPIWGWFGQLDQFAMGPTFQPRPDIGRLLLGTPSILALAAAQEGIGLSAEAGIAPIALKASALTQFAIEVCDDLGLVTTTPRDPLRRGGHVNVHHPDARHLVPALAERKVITDFREPDVIRMGCSPLTTRFTDVWDGLALLASFVSRR